MRIQLSRDEIRRGLELESAAARALDMLHVAQNDLRRYVAELGLLYQAPQGFGIRDWLVGFEQAEQAAGVDDGENSQ